MTDFYYGVIEDIYDPDKMGRVRVRVVGVHSSSRWELPTDKLPWAIVKMPTTSPSISGKGNSPFLLNGAWCSVYFLDKDMQVPIVDGTFLGNPIAMSEKTLNPSQSYVTDSSGNVVTDSSGQPVVTANDPVTKDASSGWFLGKITMELEGGKRGKQSTAVVNDYKKLDKKDSGGASYGAFQFASFLPEKYNDGSYRFKDATKRRKIALENAPLRFVKKYYPSEFAGLSPATPEFDAKWKTVMSSNMELAFKNQQEFAIANWYNPYVRTCKKRYGIDLSACGAAVQELLFMQGILFGYVTDSIGKSLPPNYKSLADKDIINLVINWKEAQTDKRYSKYKPRWKKERKLLLALAGDYKAEKPSPNAPSAPETTETEKSQVLTQETTPEQSPQIQGQTVRTETLQFGDPNGQYPRWVNESDVSRVARNEMIEHTAQNVKSQTVVTDNGVSPMGNQEGASWSEPKSPYNAKYPHNHVLESETGHLIEIDDSPSAERVHIYHRSGSFVEFHPEGEIVIKSMQNMYQISLSDNNMFVQGSLNISCQENANIHVQESAFIKCGEDANIIASNDINLTATNNINLTANNKVNISGKSGIDIITNGELTNSSTGNMNFNSGGNFNFTGSNVKMTLGNGANIGEIQDVDIPVEMYIAYEVPDVDPDAPIATAEESKPTGGVDTTPIGQESEQQIQQSNSEIQKYDEKNSNSSVPTEFPKAPGKDPLTWVNPEVFSSNSFPPSMRLTQNFTLAQVSTNGAVSHYKVKSQTANKNKKFMSEQRMVINLQQVAAYVLEPLLKFLPTKFIITSGFRTQTSKYSNSQHCAGQAVDLQFPSTNGNVKSFLAVCNQARDILKQRNGWDQMIVEYHGNNPVLHISFSASDLKHPTMYQKKMVVTTYNTSFSPLVKGMCDKNKNVIYA